MPFKIISFPSTDGRTYPVRCEYDVELEQCECRADVDGARDCWTNTRVGNIKWMPIGWSPISDTLYDEIDACILHLIAD